MYQRRDPSAAFERGLKKKQETISKVQFGRKTRRGSPNESTLEKGVCVYNKGRFEKFPQENANED